MYIFSCDIVSPPYMLYVGEEKHENEELIRWGWPEDVWFHVDKVSSAHVYLRLHAGETLDDLSQAVINDCAQLVKANSISGNKMNNVDVVYTMWSNLKKSARMDVGQVGFHKDQEHVTPKNNKKKKNKRGNKRKRERNVVRKVRVEKRLNEIVNRLNKTKKEVHPNLRDEREERDRKEREKEKNLQHQLKLKEKEEDRIRKEQAELRSYSTLMSEDNMKSNYDDGNDSDDFM